MWDSLSSHRFFIGLQTNKIIVYVCYSKHCSVCGSKNISQVRSHHCPKTTKERVRKVWRLMYTQTCFGYSQRVRKQGEHKIISK